MFVGLPASYFLRKHFPLHFLLAPKNNSKKAKKGYFFQEQLDAISAMVLRSISASSTTFIIKG